MGNASNHDTVGIEQPPVAVRGLPPRTRCRSFCFLERDGERWTVFLVTYPQEEGDWRGYFLFRSALSGADAPEIRTADLFLEASEAEVDARARGLGRPLVQALLESALDAYERRKGLSEDTRRWFRNLLAEHASERIPDIGTPSEELTLAHLRSLYDSYRLDQVAHLISLIDPDDFRALVERLLDGRSIDFRARDRFQLAMIVVQELERRLPLPPLEVWVQDFLAHREEYYVYSHQLHRGGELP
ncbi:MAG TPA: hypothetical protein VF158_06210 [Longimicrobiales bacterium]